MMCRHSHHVQGTGSIRDFPTAVSPWQFKDIDSNNAWVEQSDTLWNYRWLQAINDVKPDIVQIGTP
jgi:glucan endo-1,3-alpha-glucosidase